MAALIAAVTLITTVSCGGSAIEECRCEQASWLDALLLTQSATTGEFFCDDEGTPFQGPVSVERAMCASDTGFPFEVEAEGPFGVKISNPACEAPCLEEGNDEDRCEEECHPMVRLMLPDDTIVWGYYAEVTDPCGGLIVVDFPPLTEWPESIDPKTAIPTWPPRE